MPSAPVSDLKDLIDKVELRGIGCFELAAMRGGLREDGTQPVVGPGRLEIDKGMADHQELGIIWADTGGRFLVRMWHTLGGDQGFVRVGYQAEYEAGDLKQNDVDAAVMSQFLNKVTVMALVPYLRAAVADLSLRVFENTITQGIVRAGDFNFDVTSEVRDADTGPTESGDDPE